MRFTLTLAALTTAAITLTACSHAPAPAPSRDTYTPVTPPPKPTTMAGWRQSAASVIDSFGTDLKDVGGAAQAVAADVLNNRPTDNDTRNLRNACVSMRATLRQLDQHSSTPDPQTTSLLANGIHHLMQGTEDCTTLRPGQLLDRTAQQQITDGSNQIMAALDRANSIE